MTRQLRTHALAENLGLITSTHIAIVQVTGDLMLLLMSSGTRHMAHMWYNTHTCRQNTQPNMIFKLKITEVIAFCFHIAYSKNN